VQAKGLRGDFGKCARPAEPAEERGGYRQCRFCDGKCRICRSIQLMPLDLPKEGSVLRKVQFFFAI